MNTFIIFLAIITSLNYIQANEREKEFFDITEKQLQTRKECKKEFNITDDIKVQFFWENATATPPRNFKCLLACFGEKLGYIKSNKMDWELISVHHSILARRNIDRVRIEHGIEKCKNIIKPQDDICEYSYEVVKCMIGADKQLVFKGMSKEDLQSTEDLTLEQCRVNMNLDSATVEQYFNSTKTLPSDHDFKCLLRCQDEYLGYVKKDGKIDWNTLKLAQGIYYQDDKEKEKYVQIVDNCEKKDIKGSEDKCEISYQLINCFQKEYLKHGLPWK